MYQVTDRDGILYPITMGGVPVRELQPGWYPVGLQTGLPPFHLLELRNDSGAGADGIWYLTDELEFITHTARHLGQDHAGQVVAHLSPLLHDIYEQSLCAAQPQAAPSSRSFDGINPAVLRELIGLVVERALSPPDVVMADRLAGVSEQYTAGGLKLSAGLIRHSLDVTTPGAGEPDPTPDPMLASPFDAGLLASQERFVPDGGAWSQCHRFRDPTAEVTLYLATRSGGLPALYVPVMNTIFTNQEGVSGAEVMTTLFAHYAVHGEHPVPAAGPEQRAAEASVAPQASAEADLAPGPAEPGSRPNAPTNWWKRVFGLGHP